MKMRGSVSSAGQWCALIALCLGLTVTGAVAQSPTADNVVKVVLTWEDGTPFPGAGVTATDPDGNMVTGLEVAPGAYLLKGSDMTRSILEVQHAALGYSTPRMPIGMNTEISAAVVGNPAGGYWLDRDLGPGVAGQAVAGSYAASALQAPSNDTCSNATTVSIPSTTSGTTVGAGTDGAPYCGTSNTAPGVWYRLIGNGYRLTADTCTNTSYDSKITVYKDGCGTLTCVDGNDDSCSLQSSVSWCAENGVEYLILVHGYSSSTGAFDLRISQGTTCGPPANDDCDDATAVSVPSVTVGSTSDAAADGAPFCGTSNTAPGVWYEVAGSGRQLTAHTCTSTSNYDTKMSVFCKDCNDLVCVDGNDDMGSSNCSFSGLRSSVTWCGQPGVTYKVLVHGYSSSVGDFGLDVSEGSTCSNFPSGCAITGACCMTSGGCAETLPGQCAGVYQGDNTDCGGFRDYAVVTGGDPFEDISGTGTAAPSAGSSDDGGDTVGMGFTFRFWGDDHTDIGISSNGYVTFHTDLTDFSNDMIPSSTDPDDFAAPLWDDLDTRSSTAMVHTETRGTAGRRRFIGQWTDVPQLGGSTTYTFQVVLFERSNCIEFRYEDYTNESFAGDYTIGVENQDGSEGLAILPGSIQSGDTIRICPQSDPNPCNQPPVAVCAGPYVQECEGAQTAIPLDGSLCYDPDGDPLTYEWTTDCPGGTFDDPTAMMPILTVDGAHCNMLCTASLTVTDPYGESDTIDSEVTVQDTIAPVVEEGFDALHCMWAPNHKYICVDATYFAPVITEACSDTATWWFTACSSNQPDDDLGDGSTIEDCILSPDQSMVCMRSERQGGGEDGRSYKLAIQAADGCGNVSGEMVMGYVAVPHDSTSRPKDCLDASELGCKKGEPIPCR